MRWMHVEDTARRSRPGASAPLLAGLVAQARKSWLAASDYQKGAQQSHPSSHRRRRAPLTSRRAKEMNSIICKGIFYDVRERVRDEATGDYVHRFLTKALPELSPLPVSNSGSRTNGDTPSARCSATPPKQNPVVGRCNFLAAGGAQVSQLSRSARFES